MPSHIHTVYLISFVIIKIITINQIKFKQNKFINVFHPFQFKRRSISVLKIHFGSKDPFRF
jgi:hypothetical protein